MNTSFLLAAGTAVCLSSVATAQDPTLNTQYPIANTQDPTLDTQDPTDATQGAIANSLGTLGSTQVSRFSTQFNPAFFFVVDTSVDNVNNSGATPDGFSTELRSLEIGAQSWIDPTAWAYFIGASNGESMSIEEGAIQFSGFEGNSTLRAGRFFIDFGKQMQIHIHELRTVERPLVLRAFLGDEVNGDGFQWDSWASAGDQTLVRWSIGAFNSLTAEENEFTSSYASTVQDRKSLGDVNFTARVTALTDYSDNVTLQVGASGRWIPNYDIEFTGTGDTQAGLSSSVYGLDATYRYVSDTGVQVLTVGSEWLTSIGDNNAVNPTPGTINVLHSNLSGYLAFVDYAWTRYKSAGIQYSAAELGDVNNSSVSEIAAYYTKRFSEYQRLRFGVNMQTRENGEDSTRLVIQYTAVLGAHGHGVRW